MTAKGRIVASQVTAGTRLIVAISGNGRLVPTTRKTGQLVTVTGTTSELVSHPSRGAKAARRYTLTTDKGLVENLAPAQTLTLAPEAPTAEAQAIEAAARGAMDATLVSVDGHPAGSPEAKALTRPRAAKLSPAEAKAARTARRAVRKEARAAAAPAGYVLTRAHSSFSVFKLAEGGTGAAWLCRCEKHYETAEATSAGHAVELGRKEARARWCAECA